MTIQLRRDTAANWTAANPTLAAGQPGYETDTKKLKIGDGSTAWNSLAYFGGAGVAWGAITGTLSSQTDLNTALGGKQPLAAVLTATTASYTTTLDTKLAGIATGATANQTDAYLLSRANHTGTQAWSTITSTPTTLSGYGISDGITAAAVAAGYQPLDADLTAIAGLTATTNNVLQSVAGVWASRTPTQVTATLDTVTSGAKGLAPASGGGTTNFLRADLTWAAPPLTTTLAWSSITATPTTLAGYGIIDGITSAAVAAGYQPLDSDLTTIAALTATTDSFMQSKSGAWSARTIAQVKADLGPLAGSATLTLSADAYEVEQVITATGVTTGSIIQVSLQAGADSDENTADMLDLIGIGGIPGTGQITVKASFSIPTCGAVLINWSAF